MKTIQLLLNCVLLQFLYQQSFAQSVRSCDLQIAINSPANNQIIEAGDTAWIAFTVVNNGPDDILASDTLWFWDRTNVLRFLALSDIPANTDRSYTSTELGNLFLFPYTGVSDINAQICLKLVNQSTIFYDATTGPLVTFEDPDTANNWSCVDITRKGTQPSDISNVEYNAGAAHVYPNPASNEVKIDFNPGRSQYVTVNVRDISGKKIMEHRYNRMILESINTLTIDIEGLCNGLYFVELFSETQRVVKKLNVQN